MEQKISEIKEIFQAAVIEELPELIEAYFPDKRSGVAALVKGAEKKLALLEKEKGTNDFLLLLAPFLWRTLCHYII